MPARSVQELIAYAKANPDKLNFGSSGNGSSHHLAAELFNMLADIKTRHVPYKGTAMMMTDLLGGQIQFTFDPIVSSLAHVRDNKLRALAVTSVERVPMLPDLPSMQEAGVVGYDIGSWYGLMAPAGTPKAIVDKILADVDKVLAMPEVKDKLAQLGATPIGGPPERLEAHIRSEIAKLGAERQGLGRNGELTMATSSKTSVGLIGLGQAGASLATALARRFEVVAYDRDPARCAVGRAAGLHLVDQASAVADLCEIVMMCLPTPRRGRRRRARTTLKGKFVIENSTVSPDDIDWLVAHFEPSMVPASWTRPSSAASTSWPRARPPSWSAARSPTMRVPRRCSMPPPRRSSISDRPATACGPS